MRIRGLADSEVGFVLGAFGLAAIVAPMVLGHFADQRWNVGRMMQIQFICGAVFASIWWVARGPLALFFVTLAFHACFLPALSMIDAHTLKTLGAKSRDQFQSIRLWGSIGFLVPAIVGGVLRPDDEGLHWMLLSVISLSAIVAVILCGQLRSFEVSNSGEAGMSRLPSALALRATLQPPLRNVIWPAALGSLGLAIYYSFFPLLLRSFGLTNAELGLVFNLGVAAEIIVMPFAGVLLRRFGSRALITTAMVCVLLRTGALAISDSLPVAIMTQLLHGPIVVGFFVTLPVLLREIADDTFHYSLQSLYVLIFFGVVRLAAPWIASVTLLWTGETSETGIRAVFFVAAVCAVSGLVLQLLMRGGRGRALP